MSDMSKQMEALDDFVAKARSHNGKFHEAQLGSLNSISSNVQESRLAFQTQLGGFEERIGQLQTDVDIHTSELEQSTAPLQEDVRQPLTELRSNIKSQPMQKYSPTGSTPKKRKYEYPTTLPNTEPHDSLRKRHRTSKQFTALPFSEEETQPVMVPGPSSPSNSPSKQFVFSDAAEEVDIHPPSAANTSSNTGLREVDLNVAKPPVGDEQEIDSESSPQPTSMDLDHAPTVEKEEPEQQPRKRRRSSNVNNTVESKLPHKMLSKKMAGMMEGRENVPPSGIPGGRRYNRTRSSN